MAAWIKVEYHPLSVSDLNEAVAYYNQQREMLGDELRLEVYAAVGRVRSNPAQYPVTDYGMRRCLVHRFPYSVHYRLIDSETIRILIVRHQHRHPRFGMNRR